MVNPDAITLMISLGIKKEKSYFDDEEENEEEERKKTNDAIQKKKYDLILLDCHMPDMDGFIATQKIREYEKNKDDKNIIVALTANTLMGTKERCLSVGMDDYLSKPVNYSHLCSVLCKHLPSTQH